MDSERDSRSGQGAPLPGFGEAAPHDRDRTDQGQADRSATNPAHGIRHVQRMSNWTAAALMVGTGAATVALAHHAFPAAAHRQARPPRPGPALRRRRPGQPTEGRRRRPPLSPRRSAPARVWVHNCVSCAFVYGCRRRADQWRVRYRSVCVTWPAMPVGAQPVSRAVRWHTSSSRRVGGIGPVDAASPAVVERHHLVASREPGDDRGKQRDVRAQATDEQQRFSRAVHFGTC